MTKRRFNPTLYPVFTMYLAGVGVALGIAGELFSVDVGLVVLTVIASMLIMMALTREVRVVHTLVSAQRDELLARIDVLTTALEQAQANLPSKERARG